MNDFAYEPYPDGAAAGAGGEREWQKQQQDYGQQLDGPFKPMKPVSQWPRGEQRLPGMADHQTAMTFGAESPLEQAADALSHFDPGHPKDRLQKDLNYPEATGQVQPIKYAKLPATNQTSGTFKAAAPVAKQKFISDDEEFEEDDLNVSGAAEAAPKWNQSSIDQKTEASNITGANITALFPKGSGRGKKGEQPNQMYAQLYHEMMAGTKRGQQGRMAALHPQVNPFEQYKKEWNRYQEKQDHEYQKQLRAVHKQAMQRFASHSKERERGREERELKRQRDEEVNILKTCTFSPQVQKEGRVGSNSRASNSSSMGKKSSSSVSQGKFYAQEQQFLQRKKEWREQIIQKRDQAQKSMAKTRFISQASQEIWDNSAKGRQSSVLAGFSASSQTSDFGSPRRGGGDAIRSGPFSEGSEGAPRLGQKQLSSTASAKSISHQRTQQFLHRNLYSITDHRQTVLEQAKQNYQSHLRNTREQEFQSMKKPSGVSKSYATLQLRSRGSSINSNSSTGKRSAGKMKDFHQPILGSRSSELGSQVRNKSKKNVFRALVDDAYEKEVRLSATKKKYAQQLKSQQKQHAQKLINPKSELGLADKFKELFEKVWADQLTQGSQLFLIDMVEDLQFVHHELMSQSFRRIDELLQMQHISLLIDIDKDNELKTLEIHNNLLQVCLAIVNNRTQYESHPCLEDQILKLYLSNIHPGTADRQQYIVDQIMCIKHLVNRKAFSLNEKQVRWIHGKYQNYFEVRRDIQYNEKKDARLSKVVQEESQKYRSKPEIGRSPVPARNQGTMRSARKSGVSNRSSQASASPGKSPLGHRMYTEAMNKKLETDRLRAQLIQQKQLEELEGATFSPKVNTKPSKGPNAKHYSRTAPKSSKKDDTKSVASDGSGSALREEHLFDDDVFRPVKQPTGNEVPLRIKPDRWSQRPGDAGRPRNNKEAPPRIQNQNRDMLDRERVRDDPRPKDSLLQNPAKQKIQTNVADYQPKPLEMQRFLDQNPTSVALPAAQKPLSAVPSYPIDETQKHVFQPPPWNDQDRGRARPENSRTKRLLEPSTFLPTVEEPICVLKIELDGQNVEEIKVFENDDPNQIVEEFGMKFNLSSNAKRRLLDQINDQIQIDDSSQY